MPIKILFVCTCLLFFSCKQNYKNPRIKIETGAGNIEIELYPTQAPRTVSAFLSYVDSGLYKNASFYRVLNLDNQPSDAYKAELIQGGIYRSNHKRYQSFPGIPHENTKQTGLHHEDGVISL